MRTFVFNKSGLILLAFAMILISSCETGGIFRSEKRIDRLLQGVWDRQNFTAGGEQVRWEFSNGTLKRSILVEENGKSTWEVSEEAQYEVDAGFSRAFINIRNLELNGTSLSGKWQIYDIDKQVLIIFTKDLGGTITREFVKTGSE